LPDTYGNLTAMETLLLDTHPDVVGLSGTLPTWAGSFVYGVLVTLDNNNFTGPIPSAWCSTSEKPFVRPFLVQVISQHVRDFVLSIDFWVRWLTACDAVHKPAECSVLLYCRDPLVCNWLLCILL